MKAVLYISYDGMTDPLGQSQVIPYLRGLAGRGHRITILSCEKEAAYAELAEGTRTTLRTAGIAWHHVPYTKMPPVASTGYDLVRLHRLGVKLATATPFDIVHGRTILPTLVGERIRRTVGRAAEMKLVFDTRSFWTDERVEGGLWDLRNPVFAALYRWFKAQELRLYGEADLLFTLTGRARDHIEALRADAASAPPIHVVPCCADLDHFDPERLDPGELAALRTELGLDPADFVLTYLGSLGTRYMLDEMMAFFAVLRQARPRARFMFITRTEHDAIRAAASDHGVPTGAVVLAPTTYARVPEHVALGDASVFFIRTGDSGRAVSPVKQAELLGMGQRVVCNAGIGDTDEIVGASGAGMVLDSLDHDACRTAVGGLLEDDGPGRDRIRAIARDRLSLVGAVERYHDAWVSL